MELLSISKAQYVTVTLTLHDVKEISGALGTHYDSLKHATIGQKIAGESTRQLIDFFDRLEDEFS